MKHLIIIISVMLFALCSSEKPARNGEQPDEPDTLAVNIPSDWEWYNSQDFFFKMAHPPNASVQIEATNHVKFMVLGSDNATGEITDGFTLTVSIYEKLRTQSLGEFAREKIKADLQIAEKEQGLKETTFHNQPAFFFSTTNLGTVHHILTLHGEHHVIGFAYNLSDPHGRNYQQTVNTMLKSVRLQTPDPHKLNQALFDTVHIAFLDPARKRGSKERGCDTVIMIPRKIKSTDNTLDAALDALFMIDSVRVHNGLYNFIAKTRNTLSVRKVLIQDDTAHIWLRGELSGLGGVCDNPRTSIQITETALYLPAVEQVILYLNGEENDLVPDAKGK